MSLYVLTLSVNSSAHFPGRETPREQQERVAVNDLESFSESAPEQYGDLENPVPEQDEPEEEAQQTLLVKDYVFTQPFSLRTPAFPGLRVLSTLIPFQPAFVAGLVAEITSPPPQRRACQYLTIGLQSPAGPLLTQGSV